MRCSVSMAKLMVMFKSEHTASIYRFVQNFRFSQRATFIRIDSGLRGQCLVLH